MSQLSKDIPVGGKDRFRVALRTAFRMGEPVSFVPSYAFQAYDDFKMSASSALSEVQQERSNISVFGPVWGRIIGDWKVVAIGLLVLIILIKD